MVLGRTIIVLWAPSTGRYIPLLSDFNTSPRKGITLIFGMPLTEKFGCLCSDTIVNDFVLLASFGFVLLCHRQRRQICSFVDFEHNSFLWHTIFTIIKRHGLLKIKLHNFDLDLLLIE